VKGLAAGSLAITVALAVVAGCSGGGGKLSTTTSSPPSSDESTTSSEPSTTSTSIDPTLQDVLLVAADVTGFKEQTTKTPTRFRSTTCSSTTAPALNAISTAPTVDGAIFERGADAAVKVSSRAIAAPDKAQAALTELLDPKLAQCLQDDLRAILGNDPASGTIDALKMTVTKATLSGVDQTVTLAGVATAKDNNGAAKPFQLDLVFLRSGSTILVVSYSGPSGVASVAERQRIVVAAGRRLSGSPTGPTTTQPAGGSTSSTRRTSTTRRVTTTTHQASTSSTNSSSTTAKATTTVKP